MLPEFRYTIIIPSVDSYVLNTAPIGWEDNTEISYKRSEQYFGQVRSVTVPLKFSKEGAKILRNEFYRYNAQALAYLLIEKIDPSTFAYVQAEYCKLDFSKATDSNDEFTLPAVGAGIEAKIKAFENVKYEFDIDVPEAIEVMLTPITLIESAQLLFTPSEQDQQPGFTGLEIITNEIKSVNNSVQDVQYTTSINPNFATSDKWFYNAQLTNTVKVKIEGLKGSIQSLLTGSNRFTLNLVKSTGVFVATFYDRTISNTAEGFDINYEINVSMGVGEKLFLFQRIEGTLGGDTGFNFNEGILSASYSTQSPETKCKALRGKYLLQQLIKKMNGGFDYPVQSILLDQWAQLAVTSGDAIRRLSGAKIKTSFTDFFKSYSAVTCAGHSVENEMVTMEYRPSYYRNVKTLSLLDSKDVEINSAYDLLINAIKTGYQDQTYDEVNGKQEINSQQNYVIDTIGVQRELDIMSEYRADPYGIEFLRINLDGKSSTDSNSDNDVFFLYLNSNPEIDGSYKPFTTGIVTGVTAGDSLYNWYISPKRNLIRWGAYIRSLFYGNDGYQIRFASALKNSDVMTSVNGVAVKENSNITMAELDAPYFIPMYGTFTTKLPNDLWKYFNNGVYGYAEFMYKGVVLNGYFIEADIDLAMNSEQEFRVLLTTQNNLLELIR